MNYKKLFLLSVLASFFWTTPACQTVDPKMYADSPPISRIAIKKFTEISYCDSTKDFYDEHYLVRIKTRPLVYQKFILSKPKNPVASLILFAGGAGTLDLNEESGILLMNRYKYNFLVRTRSDFANHNLVVAVIDSPSDKIFGMEGGFRTSEAHLKDIEEVISFLKKEANLPVWLIGTSRGTESAAYIASHSESIAGLVLSSSISSSNQQGTSIITSDLSKIRVPTLIIAHEKDNCSVTPPSNTIDIKNGLTHAPKVEVKYFTGGKFPLTGPCDPLSPHGFFGIENEVISFIAGFIESNVR